MTVKDVYNIHQIKHALVPLHLYKIYFLQRTKTNRSKSTHFHDLQTNNDAFIFSLFCYYMT